MRNYLFAVSLAAANLFLAAKAAPIGESPIDGARSGATALVVFGDSWSDTGNAFKLTSGTWPRPQAYYQGRFSNGPIWVDSLASRLHTTAKSYAYGGATSDNNTVKGYTGPDSTVLVPSVNQQVAQYVDWLNAGTQAADGSNELTAEVREHKLKATHIFWAGANDIFFATFGGLNITATQVVSNIVASIENIYNAGGRRFLVNTLPQLDLLPFFQTEATKGYAPVFAKFTTEYNAALKKEYLRLSRQRRSLSIKLFDAHAFLPTVHAAERKAQCLNTTTLVACKNPADYLYWDEYHFTTATHARVAEAIAKKI
ncbi:GDSL lipase/esterase [Fimicolochytrium jonesii]|uniref:GDSL lipase/esterase n=1 Tax=Fimicolochytrium jonesii TaxID=1396493 RepID=UPI0022FF12F3|nr:GDSL lipase/esterase [Fimicolochytrium jonesii]KAI8822486.1 GDSL lipase/esterase [Fimicolochytrium jonesii]